MAESRKIIRYTFEITAISVLLAGMFYFMFAPEAFDAFLAWLVSL